MQKLLEQQMQQTQQSHQALQTQLQQKFATLESKIADVAVPSASQTIKLEPNTTPADTYQTPIDETLFAQVNHCTINVYIFFSSTTHFFFCFFFYH
jgi:hypothetical protein